jgi:hypothetical protein
MNRYEITTLHIITKNPHSVTYVANNPYEALRQAFGGDKCAFEFTVTGSLFTVVTNDGFAIHNGIIKQIDHNI